MYFNTYNDNDSKKTKESEHDYDQRQEHNLPYYSGGVHPNCDYHHGQITPAIGVKCYQVTRANRCCPELSDGTTFTYKHAPDIAYWRGKFYIQYLCNPKDEHTGEGIDILASSSDGITWGDYKVSFPSYLIRPCTVTDYKGLTHSFDGTTFAFIHHRMCFYKSSDNRMLLLSFYGWAPHQWNTNWDNYGVGRVVRELYEDGSMGDIYFIRVNRQGGWSKENLNYPLFNECGDIGFVNACNELLSNKLYVQQWAEENGDIDELIQIKHPKKGVKNEAFCWYHIDEKTIIGLWKHSRVARSDDNGATWSDVVKSDSLVMSGQKVWAEKTSDGKYAMVYDPTLETQHRYPLCVTTSNDGVEYSNMLLVHGEVPPMRFEGFWKDLGPQYMRGIIEGLDGAPDGALWVTYSVNKEDIWVARIPVPIQGEVLDDIEESFENKATVEKWNLYCPKWAQATVEPALVQSDGGLLKIKDAESYDYCKVERVFNRSDRVNISFDITPQKIGIDGLYIEVCNSKAQIASRLVFRKKDNHIYSIFARTVTEIPVIECAVSERCSIELDIDCKRFCYTISVNGELMVDSDGEPILWKFMMAVNEVSRFILRTGAVRHNPTLDYIPDDKPENPLIGCDDMVEQAEYDLHSFKAIKVK